MRRFRILIANQPRYYREVIAAGLRAVRPDLDVVSVEPAALAASAHRLVPDVIVCHPLGDALSVDPLAWVLLPIDDRNPFVVSIAGEETTVQSFEFHDLLTVIDAVEPRSSRSHR